MKSYGRIETFRRYILANSLREGLDEGADRNNARAAIIRDISGLESLIKKVSSDSLWL